MTQLTVAEAAATYQTAMRNVLPSGTGICAICRTFIGDSYTVCFACNQQPKQLNLVAPISYSEHLGQLHLALRGYKDGLPREQSYAMPRLAGILWQFLEIHEACVAAAAGAPAFDVVTTVPSSTPARDDERPNFRTIVSSCDPISARYQRVVEATGDVPAGREYDPRRYRATARLDGCHVLLLDDTWTAGGHAQAAANALRAAGAQTVALVVIGRHLRREWEVAVDGPTCGELFDQLPRSFDWQACAVHVTQTA